MNGSKREIRYVDAKIEALLDRVSEGSTVVREFMEVLRNRWRSEVYAGSTRENFKRANVRLREGLTNLLAWAESTGRM